MFESNDTTKLATALALAQGEIEDAKKDSSNPAFRSKYADLASVRAAIRDPLAKNGLSIIQMPRTLYHDVGDRRVVHGVEVTTILIHNSGERFVSEPFYAPVAKPDAHGIGSALTYLRRYSLSSILNVASDIDDDGNAAAGVGSGSRVEQEAPKFAKAELDRIELRARDAASKGRDAFAELWKELSPDERAAINMQTRKECEQLAKAADAIR